MLESGGFEGLEYMQFENFCGGRAEKESWVDVRSGDEAKVLVLRWVS